MPSLPDDIRIALAPLRAILHGIAVSREGTGGHFALAFSGGMDSRFLAHAAHLLGFRPHLLMAVGPQLPQEEAEFGQQWARSRQLTLRTVEVDPLSQPLVAENHRRRCYECKREIFVRLREALQTGADDAPPLALCDGTNASDAFAYRPGTQAVQELGVRSPLALAGLSKAEIYRLAAICGMERPAQKPRPCLLTRLPYGMRPERDTLLALAAGERAVRNFLEDMGMPEPDFRLRLVPQEKGGTDLELHLLRADASCLPQKQASLLAERIAEAAPSLPAPLRVAPQDSLSGFFDRLQYPHDN